MKKNLLRKAGETAIHCVALGILPIAVTYAIAVEAKEKVEAKIYKLRNKDILKEEQD